jgi:UDP-N-acetylmuramate dehydrogenase
MTINIQENVSLASHTTMRTGGPARFFVSVETIEDLESAFAWVKEHEVSVWVLGGGSNTLVPDEGFSGLVIKISLKGISFEESTNCTYLVAGAGEVWDDVVSAAVTHSLWGIENLSLVPGLVGGSVVQNIGAYGIEVKESVAWVEIFDTEEKKIKRFLNEECNFGYRESVFKTKPQFIVVRVAFKLSHLETIRTEYEDVKKYFAEKGIDHPSLQEIRSAVISIRTDKMPGAMLGTAGSFFKNPIVSKAESDRLEHMFPGIKIYPVSASTVKLSAAWLIDNVAKFRGVKRGDAGMYEKQALILVNHGAATSQEIISLAQEIKNIVHEKTNVMLEEEVVMMR